MDQKKADTQIAAMARAKVKRLSDEEKSAIYMALMTNSLNPDTVGYSHIERFISVNPTAIAALTKELENYFKNLESQ